MTKYRLLHPGRLTWNLIMKVWNIIFLSKWMICRFHVNLPGCISIWDVLSATFKTTEKLDLQRPAPCMMTMTRRGAKSRRNQRVGYFLLGGTRSVKLYDTLGGGNSKIFDVHPYFGEDSQIWLIFFQVGWNHQLENDTLPLFTAAAWSSFEKASHFARFFRYPHLRSKPSQRPPGFLQSL